MSVAKRNSLLLLLLALLLIQGLVMGLPNLKLSNGEPFSLGSDQSLGEGGLGALFGENIFAQLIRGIWVLTLICIPLYIIISLLTPEGRRRLKRDIFTIIFILLLSKFLPELLEKSGISMEAPDAALPQDYSQLQTTVEATTTFSPDPPAWISVMTVLLAALLISALIIGVFMLVRRRKAQQKSPLEKLAGEAQTAIEALQAGRDFKSTIIHCYQEMVKVVEEEKGIYRETAMTPREFEASLIGKGLPQVPIQTITRLFEKVRYGSLVIDAGEENLAFASLSDIVNACQSIGAQRETK